MQYLTTETALFVGQIIAISSNFLAALAFGGRYIPYLNRYIESTPLKDGWIKLQLEEKLNESEEGFEEVSSLIQRRTYMSEAVTDDLEKYNSDDINMDLSEDIEMLSIKNRFGRGDWVLVYYDVNTDGPYSESESEQTENHGFTLINRDDAGDGWRWLGPVRAIDTLVSQEVEEIIFGRLKYGSVFLFIGFLSQLAIFLVRNAVSSGLI